MLFGEQLLSEELCLQEISEGTEGSCECYVPVQTTLHQDCSCSREHIQLDPCRSAEESTKGSLWSSIRGLTGARFTGFSLLLLLNSFLAAVMLRREGGQHRCGSPEIRVTPFGPFLLVLYTDQCTECHPSTGVAGGTEQAWRIEDTDYPGMISGYSKQHLWCL